VKGRKPSAAAAKRGTARKRNLPALTPPEHPSVISPDLVPQVPLPRQLPDTAVARELWRLFLREVSRTELREGDLPLVEAMCVAKYRHFRAGQIVKRRGMLMMTDWGPVKNPMLKEERDQAMLYDRLAQRLGLSPEARVHLNLMKIAGATLLGSLHEEMRRAVDREMDEVVEGEAEEVD
jgi:P27 family predicted phage terminase small subunit